MKDTRPTAVASYVFAGGFTVGVSKRFNVLAHLEEGDFGVATAKANFPGTDFYVGLEEWPLAELFAKQVDVVYGNPPCQPWSSAGRSATRGRDNWKTDERVDGTRRFLKLCWSLQPTIWCMENVPRFWTTGREFVDWIIRRLLNDGRHVYVYFHDPRIMGLPQKRRRVLLVGSRVALHWPLPKFTPVTMRESFAASPIREGLIRPLCEEYQEILSDPRVRDLRGAWLARYPEGKKGTPSFMMRLFRWDSWVGVVTSHQMDIHPNRKRYLTQYEYARLCGFPDDYIWTSDSAYTITECALGVSPVASAHFAEVFHDGLMNQKSAVPGVTFIDQSGGSRVFECVPRDIVKDLSDLYEEALHG